ncbi:hypothetical protein PR202_ga25719 [Eleusine coracana subsp. coracana]|uniref:J domain-containing protein n=1 Tax=Eleusine coracana subsp. coracana TaxID=191504 RepID=A0AAV5DC65_ELECO|nr:hypothetical protein PR202_ga25719 [Eleusine coracana subsp. coracana]
MENSKRGGWGFVIRNQDGTFLEGGTGNIQGVSSALQAEALVAIQGLERAAFLGMPSVHLETDAAVLGRGLLAADMDDSREDEEDELVWQFSSNGIYSSQSLYKVVNYRDWQVARDEGDLEKARKYARALETTRANWEATYDGTVYRLDQNEKRTTRTADDVTWRESILDKKMMDQDRIPAASVLVASKEEMATTVPSKEEMARKAQMKAEESFLAGNVLGAKQWMVSAVRLAPDLPGNAQAAAAYNVHAAAAARSPPDCWYAVLGLPDPRSGAVVTRDAVKRQHRKLCLLVHPDKNASKAAGSAFKLVQDAFDALSSRHPPSAAATTPPPPPPQTPCWPPRPPEKPRPRPQVVQMQRPSSSSRYSSRQPEPKVPMSSSSNCSQKTARPPPQRRVSPPPAVKKPSEPVAGSCPACGASTTSAGKSNFRCMSCQWSPMDQRRHDDDDYDYDDYDDGYYQY